MCGCSILLTSVLSQWYSTYGWMNIQDVISGWVEVWLKHQATGLATLATCHSPPFEKGAPVRFLLSCWCIHLCIYKASPLPAYLCSSKKRTGWSVLFFLECGWVGGVCWVVVFLWFEKLPCENALLALLLSHRGTFLLAI